MIPNWRYFTILVLVPILAVAYRYLYEQWWLGAAIFFVFGVVYEVLLGKYRKQLKEVNRDDH